jgi:hypothetical protein
MHKHAAAAALCASLAAPGLGGASLAARRARQVVTVVGKTICYGDIPARTGCDFKLPAAPSARPAPSRRLQRVEARFAPAKSAATR